MQLVRAAAAAKLNLYLHALGRRPDGYHELDSLVGFASAHDLVEVAPADRFSLSIQGPFSGPLLFADPAENLVWRAAHALAEALGRPPHAAVTLTKNLPVASGIGGGSADAAAALRALAVLWDLPPDDPRPAAIAPTLGADVPVCLLSRTSYFGGAGERVAPAPELPETWLVLVNPGIHVMTRDVFAARTGPWSAAARLERAPDDVADLARMLAARGNDLQAPALSVAPVIGAALAALDVAPGCLLSRMSGSGATCFGLFRDADHAVAAAQLIARVRPDWWVKPAALLADVSGVEIG
ncbi:MAG TPA: 4-(cytidine 5'-diphospho)-2-C-methyl-D-erythritol kinase [Azospirillaceae bacterium]|nr:4-(cytidine 5'-diphospho)-2-C-methyl-D-erythritol kinase [Azospirillaceae bacterium]